ncbi:hypothetical protein ACE6H2_005408 [Prunus campanulata]
MSSCNGDPSQGLQIVGMSATMPNVTAIANWLQVHIHLHKRTASKLFLVE